MRLNQNTFIIGHKIILVPYKFHHVTKYHKWMENEGLRQQTASERLTLEEEYKMQETWLNDDDKCTFIILDRKLYEESDQDEVHSMVGDVNLFLNDVENQQKAEVEVMIAETTSRGRGLGKESVLAMIFYGTEFLNVKEFSAKIGYDNITSISLFQSLSFVEVSRSDAFQEVTLELSLDDEDKRLLSTRMNYLKILHDTAKVTTSSFDDPVIV